MQDGSACPDLLQRGVSPMGELAWAVSREFGPVRDAWCELVTRASCTPFQSVEWCENWQRSIGAETGELPILVTAQQNGKLVILIPLMLRASGPIRRLTWLGDRANDYNLPVIDCTIFDRLTCGDAAEIWRIVSRLVPEADYLSLSRMPASIHAQSNPFALGAPIAESDHIHVMTISGAWKDFKRTRWSKSTVHKFNQKRNQLRRMGDVSLRCLNDSGAARAGARTILRWKTAQLDARGIFNPFTPRFRAFLEDVASSKASEVWALFSQETMIAGALCLKRRDGLLIYQVAYNVDFARQSPGRLLMEDLAEMLDARGQHILDFGFGDNEYKAGLVTDSIILRKRLVAITAAGRLACVREAVKSRVIRFAKASPTITRLYHTLRTRVLAGQPAQL
jgi:CelD/BcsL family acetyltransferase involved in cellulose biosynthesis